MKSSCDTSVETLLTNFAVSIIIAISKKTKIDPDVLAQSVPGLVHSHWYIADAPVDGCLYCHRIKRLSEG
jgi:hypothetical protein